METAPAERPPLPDRLSIDAEEVWLNVDKNWGSPKQDNNLSRGYKRERSGDNLVAPANAQCHETYKQSLSTTGYSYTVPCASIFFQSLLQFTNFRD